MAGPLHAASQRAATPQPRTYILRLSRSSSTGPVTGASPESTSCPHRLVHAAFRKPLALPGRLPHVPPRTACKASSQDAAAPEPTPPTRSPLTSILAALRQHAPRIALLAAAVALLALLAALLPALPVARPRGPAALARLTAWLATWPDLLTQQLDLAITRLSGAPLWAKLLSMFSIGVPIIIPLGHLYSRASGLDLRSATLKMYALLYRAPGGSIIADQKTAALIIANCTYFAGVFVFAVLLGFVGDDVKGRLKSVRSGTYPLHLSSHVLVLGWNHHTIPFLRQMAAAQADPQSPFHRRPVVVLAARPKVEMDAAVASGLRGFPLDLHTRSGTPYRVSDLRRVSAAAARAVVVLHPSDDAVAALGGPEATEAVKAATLMTLFSSPGERCRAKHVVVQASPEAKAQVDLVRALGHCTGDAKRLQVLPTDDRTIANRLLAQTVMQPGLASVYAEIVHQGAARPAAAFLRAPASLVGATYGQARRSYPDAVLLGVRQAASQRLVVNPPNSTIITAGDRLLLLTRDRKQRPHPEAQAVFRAAAERATGWAAHRPDGKTVKPRRIIVAGWRRADLPLLLDSLAEFAPPGSGVTVVTDEPCSRELLRARGNCRFSGVVARHATAVNVLREAGIRQATGVLVGGFEDAADLESEARVMAALVQVQEACQLEGRADAPHVVAKVRQPNTGKVARQYLKAAVGPGVPAPTAEFLLPEEFSSAIISQVAAEGEYQLLVQELLGSSVGQEVYLHPLHAYCIHPGMTVTFAEVAEAARLKQQTALGLLLREGQCVLVPGAATSFKVREGDAVVVLAEDYQVAGGGAKASKATAAAGRT